MAQEAFVSDELVVEGFVKAASELAAWVGGGRGSVTTDSLDIGGPFEALLARLHAEIGEEKLREIVHIVQQAADHGDVS